MNIYKRNMTIMAERFPEIARLLESVVVDNNKVNICRKEDAVDEVVYVRDDDQRISLKRLSDVLEVPERLEKVLSKKGRHIILLLGFGLGDYPAKLLKIMGHDDVLVVCEAVPDLFKLMIEEVDFAEVFGDRRLRLTFADDNADLSFVESHHRDIVNGRFCALNQSACLRMNPTGYEKFRNKYREEKRLKDSMIATGIDRGADFADAFLANVPLIIRCPGVIRLKGMFKGRPAIVVSAGPSLEKNMHLLKQAKGRAIIIAVDVAVPTLLPSGIMPDIVVALEANRKLGLAFRDNPLLKHVPFVCSGEVDGGTVLSQHPGPLFVNLVSQHSLLHWMRRFWEDKGHVWQFGGSVAHSAFALAEYVGATSIALVGQDLSFKEKLHAGDVSKLFYDEEDLKNKPLVTDIFGESKRTMPQFLTFRTSFEKHIKHFHGVVVNATEGGIPIEGAINMRLVDFLDEYCRVPEINAMAMIAGAAEAEAVRDLDGLISHLENSIPVFDEIAKKASKIIRYTRRISKLKDLGRLDTPEAGHLVHKIETLEGVADDPSLRILAPYRYRLESYAREKILDDTDDIDAIEESLEYYSEMVRVVRKFMTKLKILIHSLQREKGFETILSDSGPVGIEAYYKLGKIYEDIGIANTAAGFFEAAAAEFAKLTDQESMRSFWSTIVETYGALVRIYMKQHRFYEAREILLALGQCGLTSSDEMMSEAQPVADTFSLLKVCEEKIRIWEAKTERFSQSLRDAECKYGSHLESGGFYYKTGDYGKAEEAYLKAIEDRCALESAIDQEDESTRIYNLSTIVSAHYGLAHTYVALGDTPKAVNALDSACKFVKKMGIIKTVGTARLVEEFKEMISDLREQCSGPCSEGVTGTAMTNS
ncbi:MAG: hypothetical protein A4E65_02063 [Syntrophorhabdus sp. PtaU1.Bin153]|nr:MAG: hypothetical protein A4E65_02063 [Syntrophorhabdus sp. PtaU1.Bin153]